MSITPRPRSRSSPPPPSTSTSAAPASRARAGELGVGDDPRDAAELGLALDRAVGAHQHGDRPEPVERRDHGEAARPGAHQHPDVLALADAEREQAADDVVDPALDRLVRVGAVLEEEELGLRARARLLVEQQSERDPGRRLQPARAARGAAAVRSPPRPAPGRRRSSARRRRRASARGRRRRRRRARARRRAGYRPRAPRARAPRRSPAAPHPGARRRRRASGSTPRPWARSCESPPSRPRARSAPPAARAHGPRPAARRGRSRARPAPGRSRRPRRRR